MLDVPGLTPDAQALYRKLIAAPSIDLGQEPGIVSSAVAELTTAGLAITRRDPAAGSREVDERRLVATPPDDALAQLLCAEEKRLNDRQQLLLAVRGHVGALRTKFDTGRRDSRPEGLAELIVGRDSISAARRDVRNLAQRELSTCATGSVEDPTEPPVAARGGGEVVQLRWRAVYDRTVFQHGSVDAVHSLAARRAGGELQRLVPELPVAMTLADESAALVSLTPNGTDAALLVRSRPLLELLRMYFDMLWSQAIPLGGDDARDDDDKYGAIPRLLAGGLTDDEVAHQLGLSIRTVRRRIAQMMEDLGAVTRFHAGVLAERAGLINPKLAATAETVIDLRDR